MKLDHVLLASHAIGPFQCSPTHPSVGRCGEKETLWRRPVFDELGVWRIAGDALGRTVALGWTDSRWREGPKRQKIDHCIRLF
jgi:hypothetical protein